MSEKIPYQNSKYKPHVEMQKEIKHEKLIRIIYKSHFKMGV